MAIVATQTNTDYTIWGLLAFLIRRALAIALAVVVVVSVINFPYAQLPLSVGLCLYGGILYRYPRAWLVVVPALLPVLDLAPWSGRFFFEEFDFLILTTAAIGFWRSQPRPNTSPIPTAILVAICFMALSYLLSFFLGLLPLEPLNANAFANYFSHYNSLRVVKGFLWAILLLCICPSCSVVQSEDREPKRLLTLGMLLGLLAVNFTVLYERFIFSGIFNFSTDLRAIGTFSGLHNGGNDIEAYLAFAAPFIVAWVFDSPSQSRYFIGTAIFALTSYSLLVTFSRGGYLGFSVTWLILIAGLLLVARSRALSLASLGVPFFAVILIIVGSAVALPILKGDFIRARFATVALDWQSRLDQLQYTFRMMDDDAVTMLFGMGLGRFPATYVAKQPAKLSPTVYTFDSEPYQSFVRIKAGSPLYLGQWISVEAGSEYVLSVDIRGVNQIGTLSVLICEKQLQKSFRCHSIPFKSSGVGAWEHFEKRFNMGEVGGDIGRLFGRLSRRPVELALYDGARGNVLDVDNVKLLDATGRNLIANGDFSSGQDRWFFTVDDLMPWQSSNHWGQLIFEQGWFGLVAFNLVVVCIVVISFMQIRQASIFAAAVIAGTFGFLTVGLFGSLFDTPRMATLFFLGSLFPALCRAPGAMPSTHSEVVRATATPRRVSFDWLSPAPLLQKKGVRVFIVGLLLSVVGLAAKEWYDQSFEEVHVDESKLPRLPSPEELPRVDLPNFRYVHPRLPAPTIEEIRMIETRNPG